MSSHEVIARAEQWLSLLTDLRVIFGIGVSLIVYALVRPETTGWQPIASAPKDGTRILLWRAPWSEPRSGGWFPSPYDEGGGFFEANCVRVTATHWHPLPAPPVDPPTRAQAEEPTP